MTLQKKETCVNVYILSACVNSPYCEQEKTDWLLKNMPNINPKNFIFTKVGESKVAKAKEIIENWYDYTNILLDDYSKNLEDWSNHETCIGIKFLNGINDTTKSWQGEKIKTFNQLEKILQDMALFGNKIW